MGALTYENVVSYLPTTKVDTDPRPYRLLRYSAVQAIEAAIQNVSELISSKNKLTVYVPQLVRKSIDRLSEFLSDYEANPTGLSDCEYQPISTEVVESTLKGINNMVAAGANLENCSFLAYPEGNLGIWWSKGRNFTVGVEFYHDDIGIFTINMNGKFDSVEWNVNQDFPSLIRDALKIF